MSVAYTSAAAAGYHIQPGTEIETSPEGLTTVTMKYRFRASLRPDFITAFSRGQPCPITAYSTLTAVANARVVEDGAFAMGYVVFQGTPAGDGTVDTEIDINHTEENRTSEIKATDDTGDKRTKVVYLAPTVTASYVAGSKPSSYRFESLVESEDDPEPIGFYNDRLLVKNSDYSVGTESKWIERRNIGGSWHITEQHARIIKQGPED